MNFLNPELDYRPCGGRCYSPAQWALYVSDRPEGALIITVAEAKKHIVIEHSDDDELLADYIDAAASFIEGVTHRAILTQTRILLLDGFPVGNQMLELPGGYVQSAGIKYQDTEGVQQTLSTGVYTLQGQREPAALQLAFGAAWPQYRRWNLPIEITYIAGYPGDENSPADYAANIPAAIKMATKMLVAHWYANREPVNIGNITTELKFTVDNLLAPYKIF